MSPTAYVDASALVKLAVFEPETRALEHELANRQALVCSRLGATELRRACARLGNRAAASRADEALEAVYQLDATPSVFETAGRLSPANLRTLDALHLATLLSLHDEPVDLITYDDRLASAARQHGVTVVMPGRAA